MMRTTTCLLAALASASVSAQSRDEPPTPVSGLEAVVYSGTAAGLKWRRASDDRGVRGYEVYREGELVDEVDALSYIVRDLVPGSLNNFSVVPVDTAGQRSNASTGIAFSTPGGASGPPAPTAPTLRAAVYSATAAGLAWTRPPAGGRAAERIQQYEVSRDGTPVFTTRDTSYIDTTLAGGRSYRYELVAVGTSGARSAPALITVETPGGDSGTPPSGDPAAPAGLRASVYSSTALGLAWTRVAGAGLRHEVRRDGQVLDTTDGTSYIDRELTGGRDYRYEVVAIDRQGRRSDPAAVTASTPGAGPVTPPVEAPVIDLDSYEAILREVIAVVNERPFIDLYDPLPSDVAADTVASDPIGVALAEVPLARIPIDLTPYYGTEPELVELTCNAGGSIAVYGDERGSSLVGLGTIRDIDGCTGVTGTLDGIGYATTTGVADGTFIAGSAGLTVSEEGRTRRFDGRRSLTRGRGFTNIVYDNTVTAYESNGTNGVERVDDYRSARTIRGPFEGPGATVVGVVTPEGEPTTIELGVLEATLESGFTLSSPSTGGQPLEVSASLRGRDFTASGPSPDEGGTPLESYSQRGAGDGFDFSAPPFNGVDEPFHFSNGQITVTAPDGSSMTLTPTGVDTLDLTVGEAIIPLRRTDGYDVSCYPASSDELCSIPLYRQ